MNRLVGRALAPVAALALALSGCAAQNAAPAASPSAQTATTVQVTDNKGTKTVTTPPASVVALDNRTFQTLAEWGVKPVAASRGLMPNTNKLKTDESIVDIGTHNEPKLELITAAEPDLIITGQRFAAKYDDIATRAPGAVQLLLDPREDQPFDSELKRQTTELGKVFGKDAEAKAINDKFDASIAAVKQAYDKGETVMAVNTSGGKIGYLAPKVGRTLGPVFDLVGFEPALKIEGATDDHQGDDISVETIAASNPDWILVMDRDAAVKAGDPSFVPAAKVLEDSKALANVTAVTKGQIVYMPADTYTNEGIQTYTTFFEELAKAFSAAK
ncbi:ABC transporter substrate-binding protein [Propioniciclava coleopterorum]|uniref:ABC transporter substrate-binding protein n=1 Tax=Propioniciclava coleopterorum TaxID=2714937 RepID=A0A6G7Y6P4_9ACTN|nr:ABC transporter substrate-binding protein [Propioniciclava coleopterorum]QIK72564.1 ABC transporter substrate-binding protein [Propioniciclava coleopterorum]